MTKLISFDIDGTLEVCVQQRREDTETRGRGEKTSGMVCVAVSPRRPVAVSSPLGRPKLHQGPFWCHVIKDRLQGHVHPERIDVALHDVGH